MNTGSDAIYVGGCITLPSRFASHVQVNAAVTAFCTPSSLFALFYLLAHTSTHYTRFIFPVLLSHHFSRGTTGCVYACRFQRVRAILYFPHHRPLWYANFNHHDTAAERWECDLVYCSASAQGITSTVSCISTGGSWCGV